MKKLGLGTIFCVVILGLLVTGCGRGNATVQIDPHSPEGVNKAIQDQQKPLSEALKTNNLQFLHNQMYYIEGLADVLSYKLQGEKKQRVDAILADLKQVAEEIDNSAGRRHKAATEDNLQNLFAVFRELDAQFKTNNVKR